MIGSGVPIAGLAALAWWLAWRHDAGPWWAVLIFTALLVINTLLLPLYRRTDAWARRRIEEGKPAPRWLIAEPGSTSITSADVAFSVCVAAVILIWYSLAGGEPWAAALCATATCAFFVLRSHLKQRLGT